MKPFVVKKGTKCIFLKVLLQGQAVVPLKVLYNFYIMLFGALLEQKSSLVKK